MEKNWKNIEGKMRVFRNKTSDGKIYFTTSLSTKKEDGSYNNMYIPISFAKTINTDNLDEEIEITKGFLTFYEANDGAKKIKIMIMELAEQGEYITVDDLDNTDELPF